jgi:hypothetical protein
LVGFCLPSATEQSSTSGYWESRDLGWGYVDNYSLIDMFVNDGNPNAGWVASRLRISDAVTCDGKPIRLDFIDFVKIQTGVNATAGG